MSVSYSIDPSARLLVIDWGDSSPVFAEVRAAIERVLQDPALKRNFGIVSDRRRIPSEPDQETVRQFLSFLARHADRLGAVRWATVIPRDQPVVFGMGRMTEALSETYGVNYRLFTDYDAAVSWASEHTGPEA